MSRLLQEAGIFMDNGFQKLPCFCTLDSNESPKTIEMIWVYKPMRRLGLGRAFVEKWDIKEVRNYVPESEGFWKKCGVNLLSKKNKL